MTTRVRTRSVWLRGLVLATVACGLTAAFAADDAAPAGTSRIEGKITLGAKKSPVADATILVYHLATAKIFRSAPTGENGRFEVTGLVHGYYDVAVETPDGLFVGNQVVNAPPDGRAISNFNLVPAGPGQSKPRDFPGAEQPPTGLATYSHKSFWKKPKGIALWVGGAVAAVAVAASLGSDDPPSQSTSR